MLNQSPGPARCGLPAQHPSESGSSREAFLLPKLRNYFAEFLSEESLVHLEVLTLTYLCRCAVRALNVFADRWVFLPGFSRESL